MTTKKSRKPMRAKKRSKHIKQILQPWKKRNTAQGSIPYEKMYDDGICFLGDGKYSLTFSFADTNYNNTSEQTRVGIFEKYCYFLNAYDDTIQIQVHINNKQLARTTTNLYLKSPDNTTSQIKTCMSEYNDMIERRLTGSDSFIQEKYITLTIVDNSYESAKKRFERIDNDVLSLLRKMTYGTKQLNKVQRLGFLRDIYRPDDTSEISYQSMARTGIYDKDIIAPYYMDTTDEQYVKLGDYYTQTLFLTEFPQDLTDELISDITSIDESLLLTINILPQKPQLAIEETKTRLKRLDKEKYDSISRQQNHGVLMPEIPRELQRALDNTEDFLKELQTRNEKMFLANILILVQAKTLEELELTIDNISNKVIKSGCSIKPFTFAQEDALNSVVPLGRNDIFIKRTFTTTSLAVFIPFNVVEIVQKGGFSYGKNKLSNNVLCLNRKSLTNPHGFYFGASGSGKSMGGKAEIWECFWRTNDDMIIIDPDGEFTLLVQLLGGQVIDVSTASKTNFNPFDINEFYGGDEEPDPVPFKSDFIISLIEVTMNYRNGIDPITRSVIDRCVREVYKKYTQHQSESNIPTFPEFFDLLKQQPEDEAKYLASALEIYITGTLNIFSHKTNIDINNRLICFNTKNLAKQLKVMGMSIIQDFCWNMISKNQALNQSTWLWNDEVHTSLRNPSTAAWLCDSWKRGRKYGLIATGMTQEVRDVCKSEEAKTLIANSEFIMLYRQKPDMIDDLAQVMSLSDDQISQLLSCESGTGLFKAGNSIVEFNNKYDEGTSLYNILSTNVGKDTKKVG